MASISSSFLLIFFVFIVQLGRSVVSEPTQDKQALLDFLSRIPHADRVRWDSSDSACDWLGVECDPSESFVYALRLPGIGLLGSIPENSVGRLTQLRVLSLRSNRLSGELPSDFSSLTLLRNLYLQDNELSGEFPASLVSLGRLTRLDLSFNNFSGPVPPSINNLTHLTGLFLQNNGFSRDLSGIGAGSLSSFNVSNNQLSGSIPESLRKFPASSFAGNLNLCGEPLSSCNPSEPPANPVGKRSKRFSTAAIIGIVIASAFVAFILLLCLLLCLRKRSRRQPENPRKPAIQTHSVAAEAETSSSKDDIMSGSIDAKRNKLVFFEGGIYSFGLEDLLRASAEVLGKGSVGTSYKAVLEEGSAVVVKRLKDVVVTKKEFESTMEVLGKMNHENLVPVRAFYYSMDEKLLVLDFMASGSLSASLHGSRGSGRTPLDWSTRLKIALSTARALSYLHITGNLVHGNIKASNVLLRPNNEALLSDFGLNPFFGPTPSTPPNRVAGYRSPEVVETQKVTFKSDVYSFGVLLLELLTGKAPDQVSLGKEGIDLPRWVQSVVREEWTAEVFDAEVMRYDNIEEEMVRLLQIAMMCVAIVPAKRPATAEVVGRIEEIFRSEAEDGLRQSSDDPSRGSDGQSSTPELRGSPRGITP